MSESIAYCGLDCFNCLAYKATIANDDDMRRKTAEEWSQQFQSDIKPEDINCLGCKSEKVFSHCNTCQIRACNLEHSLDNCAECDSFGCEKIEALLEHVPEARKNLERLKAN